MSFQQRFWNFSRLFRRKTQKADSFESIAGDGCEIDSA
jgi:hypothetical protein